MNLRDHEFVEMSFVDSSTQKSNDTYSELEAFGNSDDIINQSMIYSSIHICNYQ